MMMILQPGRCGERLQSPFVAARASLVVSNALADDESDEFKGSWMNFLGDRRFVIPDR